MNIIRRIIKWFTKPKYICIDESETFRCDISFVEPDVVASWREVSRVFAFGRLPHEHI